MHILQFLNWSEVLQVVHGFYTNQKYLNKFKLISDLVCDSLLLTVH